ncbi:membrane protein [[Brevibacterium] flavum]|uniref:Membrane protein n=1 Tax=[Brevibacterium] flavum TaxID=92706 RepID=A0A0F6SR85_9CORY|nr:MULTISPECIES: PLDc N-terminal domain-containing protein [Corynebacterium]AKF27519.1 membrane protein [[Brevibacterium] flavum]ALP50232.1 hypothetical protein AC079_08495 [Corynebacterium glutamicum]AMA00206.1 hypothetical protein APT58_08195 [Corynebacterium glutamicum]ANE08348.1 hypothetical protein A3654_08210 [Corynebacterium glutamicum]NII87229.1 hypothetical protein [Corynebacterium glutamicum]
MPTLFNRSSKTYKSLRADWLDLPTELRFPVIAVAIAEFATKVSVWVSLSRRAPEKVRGPKWVWALLTIVNGVGPAAYWAFGRKN